MRIFMETKSQKKYGFAKIAIECILQSEYFQKDKANSNDDPYRHTKLHVKIKKSINLTTSIEIYFNN